MKIYRRSFWQTEEIRAWKLTLIVILVLVFPIFYYVGFSLKMYVYFLLLVLFLMFFPPFPFFYVILTDDRLVIRNGVFPFWKGEYMYKDIVKIHLEWPGYMANHYMQVFTKKKKSWRYFIDLVDPKDYQGIVDMIRAQGVIVETKGLDEWIK